MRVTVGDSGLCCACVLSFEQLPCLLIHECCHFVSSSRYQLRHDKAGKSGNSTEYVTSQGCTKQFVQLLDQSLFCKPYLFPHFPSGHYCCADCPDMTYGPSCNYTCDCADPEEVCDSFSGACFSGQAGNVKPPISFEGERCEGVGVMLKQIQKGTEGNRCNTFVNECCNNTRSDKKWSFWHRVLL